MKSRFGDGRRGTVRRKIPLGWLAFYIGALILAAILFANGTSRAQSATATASATIVAPADVGVERSLSFGLLRGGYKKGAAGVDFNGRRWVSGGAIGLPGAPYPASGSYRVTGEPGAAYTVLAPSTVSVASETGAPPLTASNFAVYSVNLRRSGAGGRFDPSGRDRLLLAARIGVPAGTPAGAYRAEIPLVISYQ